MLRTRSIIAAALIAIIVGGPALHQLFGTTGDVSTANAAPSSGAAIVTQVDGAAMWRDGNDNEDRDHGDRHWNRNDNDRPGPPPWRPEPRRWEPQRGPWRFPWAPGPFRPFWSR
ncbi:MAG: hypothetical protein U0893_02725 [Chloroflexota bacterium]